MAKEKKKSKRLEFSKDTVKKFSKLAKSKGSKFKPYAELLIETEANK